MAFQGNGWHWDCQDKYVVFSPIGGIELNLDSYIPNTHMYTCIHKSRMGDYKRSEETLRQGKDKEDDGTHDLEGSSSGAEVLGFIR